MGGSQSFPLVPLTKERVFMVTGANIGLGYETAKWIAMMGGTVIIACRSEEKALEAITNMNQEYKAEKAAGREGLADVDTLAVEFMKVDLASLKSTMEFINDFKATGQQLHALICNAGLGLIKRTITEDGFELMFQVNYLSQFLLVAHFLPLMKRSGDDCRIILVSSEAHRVGKLDMATIQAQEERHYGRAQHYCNSKLFQIMQMFSSSRRLQGSSVSVCSGHPGLAITGFQRNIQDVGWMKALVSMTTAVGYANSAFEGAKWMINAAVNPQLKGVSNVYYGPSCKPVTPNSFSRNETKQEVLWKYTLECLQNYLTDEIIAGLEGR